MFPLGDGTLAVLDLRNRDGHQELHVLRVDPRTELVEVTYHEYPLVDDGASYYSTLGLEVSDSGAIWLLMGIGESATAPARTELVRWQPGDPFFEAHPIDFQYGENFTRRLAVLDDDTVAVLDVNIGARIRASTFPTQPE